MQGSCIIIVVLFSREKHSTENIGFLPYIRNRGRVYPVLFSDILNVFLVCESYCACGAKKPVERWAFEVGHQTCARADENQRCSFKLSRKRTLWLALIVPRQHCRHMFGHADARVEKVRMVIQEKKRRRTFWAFRNQRCAGRDRKFICAAEVDMPCTARIKSDGKR